MNFENFKLKYQNKKVEEITDSLSMNPLVSVCVQTFQHVNYVKECLDSILSQETDFNFEVLLGDDNSSDGTREICEAYAKKYPDKIRLFLHHRENNIKINGKPSGRFNYLHNLFSSKGKFIAVCEGDDYWTNPLKLQKQVDFLMQHDEVSICFHRANTLKNGVLKLHEIPEPFTEKPFAFTEIIKHYNFITTASILYRKPSSFVIPDWFLKVPFGDLGIYHCMSQGKKIQCLNETMSVYRVHSEGAWSGLNESKALENYLLFYKIIFSEFNSKGKQLIVSKMKINTYKLSKVKFPNKPLLQKLYNVYLRLKYIPNI